MEYIDSGEYAWNSGMFVFKASTYISELKKFNPEMAKLSIESYEKANIDLDFVRLDRSSFSLIEGDSIDYAVMEKTNLGKIVKLNAGWSDVGSWSSLYDISQKDENKNVADGDVILLDTKNSYIRGGKRTIAVLGLDDCAIIDSDDSILIARMEKIQDVKIIAEKINKSM